MRSSTITYESVCKQINELVTNGEKITVRNVRSHTGGQVSRVMEYVKRWREENNICNLNMDFNISEELQRALLLDKTTAIANTGAAYKAHLVDMDALLQEANEIIKSNELQINDFTTQVDTLTQQITVYNGNESNYKHTIKLLDEKLTAIQELQAQVSNELAKNELKLENANNTIAELRTQLSNQQSELLQVTRLKHEVDMDSAVWQAKYQQMESLITKFNKE